MLAGRPKAILVRLVQRLDDSFKVGTEVDGLIYVIDTPPQTIADLNSPRIQCSSQGLAM